MFQLRTLKSFKISPLFKFVWVLFKKKLVLLILIFFFKTQLLIQYSRFYYWHVLDFLIMVRISWKFICIMSFLGLVTLFVKIFLTNPINWSISSFHILVQLRIMRGIHSRMAIMHESFGIFRMHLSCIRTGIFSSFWFFYRIN